MRRLVENAFFGSGLGATDTRIGKMTDVLLEAEDMMRRMAVRDFSLMHK